MSEMRTMMLNTSSSKVGIQPTEALPKAFGIVMDLPIYDGHTATVVAMNDGHASLYTTSTFGVLGGIGHESVRMASTNFIRAAQAHFDSAIVVTNFPYPAPNHVLFYILGFDGVRVIDATIDSVEKPTSNLSALWMAGQRVLTELFQVAEAGKKGP